LNTETTRATAAESTLTNNLSTETTRAINAEATKEDVANKSTDVTTDGSSDTKYPSVKAVKDYIDVASTGSLTALTNEITRATNAENTLTANLNNEATDRTNGDASLITNLNNETTRATNAEATKEDVANKSTDVTADGSSDT